MNVNECVCVRAHVCMQNRVNFGFSATFSCPHSPSQAQDAAATYVGGGSGTLKW